MCGCDVSGVSCMCGGCEVTSWVDVRVRVCAWVCVCVYMCVYVRRVPICVCVPLSAKLRAP